MPPLLIPMQTDLQMQCFMYFIFSAQNGQEAEDKERFNGHHWAAGGVCCGKNTRPTSRKWESRILLEVERIYRVSCLGHPLIRKCFPGMGLCYVFINGCMKDEGVFCCSLVYLLCIVISVASISFDSKCWLSPLFIQCRQHMGARREPWLSRPYFSLFRSAKEH